MDIFHSACQELISAQGGEIYRNAWKIYIPFVQLLPKFNIFCVINCKFVTMSTKDDSDYEEDVDSSGLNGSVGARPKDFHVTDRYGFTGGNQFTKEG